MRKRAREGGSVGVPLARVGVVQRLDSTVNASISDLSEGNERSKPKAESKLPNNPRPLPLPLSCSNAAQDDTSAAQNSSDAQTFTYSPLPHSPLVSVPCSTAPCSTPQTARRTKGGRRRRRESSCNGPGRAVSPGLSLSHLR
jgi:hypothetical protein